MENTLHRIKKYLDFKGISVSAFEKNLSFSNGSFASQLKKSKTMGVDKLEHILNKHTDLDANWLLTGKGQMIKKNKTEPLNTEKTTFKEGLNSNDVVLLEKDLESARKELESQKYIIELQKDAIDKFKEDVQKLKSEISNLKLIAGTKN
jgi:transaldolase